MTDEALSSADDNRPALRALFDVMGDLHRRAGGPSFRAVAAVVGVSHETVRTIVRGCSHLPTWPNVEAVALELSGDTADIHRYWSAAHAERFGNNVEPPRARPTEPTLPQLHFLHRALHQVLKEIHEQIECHEND